MVVIPLTMQLTCLAGSLWRGSLRSARAERVEYLLLHEFHRLKYIVPEKYTSKEKKQKESNIKRIRGQIVITLTLITLTLITLYVNPIE